MDSVDPKSCFQKHLYLKKVCIETIWIRFPAPRSLFQKNLFLKKL